MNNNERAYLIDANQHWQCTKDKDGWWAYLYNPLNFRCEGVSGPFAQLGLAETAALGMHYRFVNTGSVTR